MCVFIWELVVYVTSITYLNDCFQKKRMFCGVRLVPILRFLIKNNRLFCILYILLIIW